MTPCPPAPSPPQPTRPAALLGWLWLCWSLLAGCSHSSSATLATLQLTLGVVERDSSAQPKVWKAAEVGSAFGFGDAVQTRAASTALLQLTDGDQLSMEPETLIRFSPSKPEPHTLDMELELGSISVSAATTDLSIRTRAGLARIAPGSRVLLVRSPEGLRFSVQVGQAVFAGDAPIEPGNTVLIDAEGARVVLSGLPAPSASAAPSFSAALARLAAAEDAGVPADGTGKTEARGLDYADTELRAGESAVIHDPAPPTAVRFAFGELCPEGGVLQLFAAGGPRSSAAGSGSASLALGPGKYRYELRCTQGASAMAAGSVQVLKDSASRRLSSQPPETTLQADGREYTVLYQNHLPAITLLWRDAPGGKALRLVHEFEQKTATLPLSGARYAFASGSLAEGTHVLHFEGADAVSRRTTLHVAFDNATPKASIATPSALPARAGEPVTIAGTALSGWSVAVEDQPARPDAQGRFSGSAIWPSERRALTIRLSHPLRGVHLYLRRTQS